MDKQAEYTNQQARKKICELFKEIERLIVFRHKLDSKDSKDAAILRKELIKTKKENQKLKKDIEKKAKALTKLLGL